MRCTACVAWLLAALMGSAVAQAPPREATLPLPDLGEGTLLRVAYVHNPRMPALDEQRLARVLERARIHVQAHFGIRVAFAPPRQLEIGPLFRAIQPRLAGKAERERMDPTADRAVLEKMVAAFVKELRQTGDTAAQKRFAARHLVEQPADDSDAAFARALLWTQHSVLATWYRLPAGDGKPLMGGDRFNEYTYWSALGSTDLPYEVIVTNQPIASAEREENSVHSALRGGVSNGITTQSLSARFGLVSILSTFPFVDDSVLVRRLRGDHQPAAEQADEYMALLLVHELGHQLLHLGHPFANASCVMTPPALLEFRAWAAQLDAGRCLLRSSAANTPGAIKFKLPAAMFR